MDFLLDNGFFIVLGVVIFAVRLFLQFQTKDKGKKSPSGDSMYVQPEDTENSRISYADTRGASDYFKKHIEESRTAPPRKTVPVQARTADFQPHWLEPEEKPRPARKAPRKQPPAVPVSAALPSAEPETPKPAPRVQEKETVRSGFPGNLAYLPPLKQAVALAEILGTPRGLD
jgi:hypothetical protein